MLAIAGGLHVKFNEGGDGGGGLNLPPRPRFELGQTMITANAQTELHPEDVVQALARYHCGDWGEQDSGDRALNDRAVSQKAQIFSAYHDRNGTKFYIITEWDRSATTIMLPKDY